MNIEELREHCMTIRGATESFPFDESTLVFKVMNKMFAYISLTPKDGRFRVCLKCDPAKTVELRELYEGVADGYHTKTLLWHSVYIDSDVPDKLIGELIQHSLDEVIKKLPKKERLKYIDLAND